MTEKSKASQGTEAAPSRKAVPQAAGINQADQFHLVDQYPDALDLLGNVHAEIGEVIKSGIVALDASVLLYAYELKSESLAAIGNLYEKLALSHRLLIPAHAVREFYKNRTKTLARVSDRLRAHIDKPAVANPFTEKLGLLEDHPDYKSAKEFAGKVAHFGRLYVERLKALDDYLASSLGNDAVTQLYREVFKNSVVDIDLSAEGRSALAKEWGERSRLGIAPGFTDGDKDRNAIGDLIFWKTVLSQAERKGGHCVVVLEEKKLDWWAGNKNNPFQPRPELVEEYRISSKGGSLFLMSLATALRHFDSWNFEAQPGPVEQKSDLKKVSLAKIARNIETNHQQRVIESETQQERQARLLAEAELLRLQSIHDVFAREAQEAKSNDEFISSMRRLSPIQEAIKRAQARYKSVLDNAYDGKVE